MRNETSDMLGFISDCIPNTERVFVFDQHLAFSGAYRLVCLMYRSKPGSAQSAIDHEAEHAAKCVELGVQHEFAIKIKTGPDGKLTSATPMVTHYLPIYMDRRTFLEWSIQIALAPTRPSAADLAQAKRFQEQLDALAPTRPSADDLAQAKRFQEQLDALDL